MVRLKRWCVNTVTTVAAVAAMAGAGIVHAQEALKIGFVNTERILRDTAPAKAAQAKLDAEFGKREKDIQDMAARLKQLGERLDRDASVIQESERVRRQREFADLEKDFQRKQREFREDLNQRRNEELAQVVEKATRIIRQVAEQEKYDLVISDAVYFNPRIDITDKVIKALSSGAPASK